MWNPLRNLSGALLGLGVLSNAVRAQGSDLTPPVAAATVILPRAVGAGLPGVMIVGSTNPLRRSNRRLSYLIQSLPFDGVPLANRGGIPGWFQNIVDRHRDPTPASEELRLAESLSALPVGPDLDTGAIGSIP